MYTLFFSLFGELLSLLSGVKYRISQVPLYQTDTSVSHLFLHFVHAWYNCICFISKILLELVINWGFFLNFFLQEKRPRQSK